MVSIRIPAPIIDAASYYDRHGIHSQILQVYVITITKSSLFWSFLLFNLQGVCDCKGIFLDIFFGWPGRSHDAFVFRNSAIGKSFENEVLFPPDMHILGDSAYPLTTYCMVPYRDNGYLTEAQKNFNIKHSSTRVVIEQAFGILKAKFRILNYVPYRKLDVVKYIVVSCVILHNLIILHDDSTIDEYASNAPSEDFDNNYNRN